MSEDARFEDADEGPLRLIAFDADDLQVIAALTQDAVFPASEMSWQPAQQRFSLLVNRFRWEDAPAAAQRKRAVERVQTLLVVGGVTRVQSTGIEKGDKDMILSLLSVDFEAGAEPAGRVVLTLAGDGAIALAVEALEVTLRDVTRPYAAPSGATPRHPE